MIAILATNNFEYAQQNMELVQSKGPNWSGDSNYAFAEKVASESQERTKSLNMAAIQIILFAHLSVQWFFKIEPQPIVPNAQYSFVKAYIQIQMNVDRQQAN